MRTRKPGHTRFYVGYKKHTLRLWISDYASSVLLVPLVSWATPAHVADRYLLKPSLVYCRRRLRWSPDIVVGDMGYIHQETKEWIRMHWSIAVLTRLKANMQAASPFHHARPLHCAQDQPLTWLGYEPEDNLHWYGVSDPMPLCAYCWENSRCAKEFSFPIKGHETFFGMIPLNTRPARKLVFEARSWIEAAQSFEKNQLGLNSVFLNSLALTWTFSLLADSAALLRSLALLTSPPKENLLNALLPQQTQFGF